MITFIIFDMITIVIKLYNNDIILNIINIINSAADCFIRYISLLVCKFIRLEYVYCYNDNSFLQIVYGFKNAFYNSFKYNSAILDYYKTIVECVSVAFKHLNPDSNDVLIRLASINLIINCLLLTTIYIVITRHYQSSIISYMFTLNFIKSNKHINWVFTKINAISLLDKKYLTSLGYLNLLVVGVCAFIVACLLLTIAVGLANK